MVANGPVYERAEETPAHEASVTDFAAALRRGDAGAYVNFLGDKGGPARVREAYPADLEPARGDRGPLRPDQPPPAQPEHPAGMSPRRLAGHSYSSCRRHHSYGGVCG